MGTTPGGYVLERRLTRAAEMLATGTATSITAIAFDLGFNDSAYFTRCFRQRFGTTPSAWRGDS
jgi:AraC-like DNA-binding protein